MAISLYLSARTILRNLKETILMIFSLTLVLALMLAATIVSFNALSFVVFEAKVTNGCWHLAYYLTDPAAIEKVNNNNNVDIATVGYRLLPQILLDSDMSLEICLYQEKTFTGFTLPLIEGQLPQNANEIIVPDWYLRNKKLSLPAKLSTPEQEFIITGVYKGLVTSITAGIVQAYSIIEANPHLIVPELLSVDPSPDCMVSKLGVEIDHVPAFAYIKLAPKAPLGITVQQLASIEGLERFPFSDFLLGNMAIPSSPEYNVDLLVAQQQRGIENPEIQKELLVQKTLPLIINGILLLALFVLVFISYSLIVNKQLSVLGILAAIGLDPKQLRNTVIIHALLIGLISLPTGTYLGIVGSKFFLHNNLGKVYGAIEIPTTDICIIVIISFLALVVAALLPAIKASKLSPTEAIAGKANRGSNQEIASPLLSFKRCRSQFSFAVIYAYKNIFKHLFRFIGIIAATALLLTVFIPLTAEVERVWKEGGRRDTYKFDYQIPATTFRNWIYNPIEVKAGFIDELSSLSTVDSVYCHYSVYNRREENSYDYDWRLDDDDITTQGKRVFELCDASLDRRNQPENFSFINGGVSGYGNSELLLAKEYLIEGSIDVEKMSAEPVILLPKYITWFSNTDLPYTKLEVGDKIVLVENTRVDGDYIPIKEYTFTIGGFLDSLPFRQVSGSSSGFVGIMHRDQLMKLGTKDKGLFEIFVKDKKGVDAYPELRRLCDVHGLQVINLKDDMEFQESQHEAQLFQMALYSIFSILGAILFLILFNLVFSSIIARKSEFAMLAALGMENRQVLVSVLTEAYSYSFIGCCLGITGGIAILIKNYSSGDIMTLPQIIPWTHIAAGAGLVFIACTVAGLSSLSFVFNRLSIRDVNK
ncbi:MAG TPA: FtsX-like permease family protein [Bacillota bacterium]|jgi:putative ABC transport system permease protein|nr:FtsX-like permease family protein [Bacillota bacterium]